MAATLTQDPAHVPTRTFALPAEIKDLADVGRLNLILTAGEAASRTRVTVEHRDGYNPGDAFRWQVRPATFDAQPGFEITQSFARNVVIPSLDDLLARFRDIASVYYRHTRQQAVMAPDVRAELTVEMFSTRAIPPTMNLASRKRRRLNDDEDGAS